MAKVADNFDKTAAMAFGQASGPPAGRKQVEQLLELLADAGHTDLRDARGPMGFTQRQAAGKFTSDEAQAFIDELLDAQHAADQPATQRPAAQTSGPARVESRQSPTARAGVPPRAERRTALSGAERALRSLTSEQLAAELQRRGWVVLEP